MTRGLLGRWIGATLVAEAVGFAAAMSLGRGVVAVAGEPTGLLAVGLAGLAGTVEGACLGVGQWLVLRRIVGGLALRAWVVATAVGGASAWMLGMTAGTHGPATMPAPWVVAVVLVVSGLVLGAVLGGAQAWVLRDRHRLAGRWVAANAIGWMVGLLFAYAGVAITTEAMSSGLAAAILATSGAAMALAPALATGLVLRRADAATQPPGACR